MKLYLARHAAAEDGEQMDPTRGLTSTGEAQVKVMARFLQTQTDKIGAVLCSSDLKRGIETAEGLAKRLDVPVIQSPLVDPDSTPQKAWRVIKRAAGELGADEELLVVSHGPLVNSLAAMLLDSGEGDKFHFSHGSIAHFDTETPAAATGYTAAGRGEKVIAYLHWLATPKLMNRAMEQDEEAVIDEALRIADSILGVRLDEKGKSYYYDTVNEKRWVLGGGGVAGNCDICEENADAGWIGDDETFLDVEGGDIDGPPAHRNCSESGCDIEYRERRYRVYESERILESEHVWRGSRLREEAHDVSDEERDDHGRWSGGGSGKDKTVSDRVQRARDSRVVTAKSSQDIATRSEKVLSAALGIPVTADNAPFDLRNDEVGIEVKTLVNGKNEKITMSKAAIGRKLAEQRADGIKVHTVAVDRRTGGLKGKATYYHREGVGSFRLGSMTKVTLAELKEIVKP